MLLLIALGGALGAVLRWVLGGWVQGHAGASFPWGTMVVNVTGALVLGFALRYLEAVAAPPEWRGFVAVGFCGGYTTFSTFGYEAVQLLQSEQWTRASAYMAGTVLLTLMAVLAGFRLAALVVAARG